jgi:hypothetical protein
MLATLMTHGDELQFYLRAEPTEEGRDLLLLHRRRLADTLHHLRLSPRLTERSDLHRTECFLGSPSLWAQRFAALGVHVAVSAEDLLSLVALPADDRFVLPGIPWFYEPFFTGAHAAAFVLRLRPMREQTTSYVRCAEQTLRTWEDTQRIPAGTVRRLTSSASYPLARDHAGGKPHVTLARVRVSRDRRRDVARTLRNTRLPSRAPIPFFRIDVRAVRSSRVFAHFAPLS